MQPHRNTVVPTYREAGARWLAGQNLYKGKRGFVYSPPVAAAFVPLAGMPEIPGAILWRLLNAGALLGGVAWWLSAGLHPGILARGWGRALVFLLLLPLALGNLNSGQVNPLLAGLLLAAFVACGKERWWLAAVCIALASFLKIYPLAAGLLLALAYPRRFAWRLAAALGALAALSFVLQRPGYVGAQYHLWFATRAADNRLLYADSIAPRDFWAVLRLLHLPVSAAAYRALELLSGAALGGFVLAARWRGWRPQRLLATAFSLVCGWMLLFGPATESATYILLAPALVFAVVEAFARPGSGSAVMRAWIAGAAAIFLVALAMNSFLRLPKNVYTLSVQPAGALLFCGYTLAAARRRERAGEPAVGDGSLAWNA